MVMLIFPDWVVVGIVVVGVVVVAGYLNIVSKVI